MKLARLALASLFLAACTTEVIKVDANGNPVGGGGSGDNGGLPSAPKSPAAKVGITQIAVFQSVKVPVVADGARVEERNAPIVAGRAGLVRVYVSPAEGFTPGRIAGELTVKGADGKEQKFRDTRGISRASSDATATSTLNFDLPADAFTVGATFSVSLTDDGGQGFNAAQAPVRYPAGDAFDDLGVQATGVLKVVVVPVKYDADGSGRTPDVSEAQLGIYKRTLMGLYPATDVQVTAREPYPWTTAITANGAGFDQILNAMVSLRRRDRAASDVYYYGVFVPQTSFESFCRRGCVSGLSGLVDDASDSALRASVGLGYEGTQSADTMAHEIGHAHGRPHAPCGGAQGVDRSFPYKGGTIGTWGYDILSKQYVSPEEGTDMMGYCDNTWVSDYTYGKLFDRIVAVSGVNQGIASSAAAQGSQGGSPYRTFTFDGNGVPTSSETLSLAEEPKGNVSEVDYLGDSGSVVGHARAHVYKYDHLEGGIVVVPENAAPYASLRVRGLTRVMNVKGLLARH